jgi:hypothetical protein
VRLRRAQEIETLSYRTVVELNAESRLAPSGGWPRSLAAERVLTRFRGRRVIMQDRRSTTLDDFSMC